MYNYRVGKERFKPNNLGSLYIKKNMINSNERPVIYIGGQMEHRWHVLEQTGCTFDPGHNMFTGNWFYDYSIFTHNKEDIVGEAFAYNLLESLKMAGLADVDLITHSYGGIIGALASTSDLIHKVYAIHAPITGTPLVFPEHILKYQPDLTRKEKLLLNAVSLVVNNKYGFEIDSYEGVYLNQVDLNKIVLVGNSLDPNNEKGIVLELYNIIKKFNGYENDGVVVFDKEHFDRRGINYVLDEHTNHFNSLNPEKLERVYQLSKKM